MKAVKITLLYFFIIPFVAHGQSKSFSTYYGSKIYNAHAQNWCVLQDTFGLIYVGNTTDLLVYDGEKWESVKLNNSIVRSLSKDSKNRIYYGAQDEFGFLYADGNGILQSKSLTHLLPDSIRNYGDIWKTYCLKNKVIFQSFDYVFIYENQKINIVRAENYFHFGYQRGNDFYIIDREIGLKKLYKDKLSLVSGGDFFKDLRIYAWINYAQYALVITREKGAFKITFNPNESILIEPFKTDIDELLAHAEVYCAAKLNEENDIGIGTLNQGMFIIDAFGKLKNRITNKNYNLKSNIINNIYIDRQKAIWLALDIGIVRIEINSRIKSMGEFEGLEGTVNTVVKYQNTLFCGTSKGLFEIKDNFVNRYKGIKNEIRNLKLIITQNQKEILLIAAESGLYKIDNNQLTKISNENCYFISDLDSQNSVVYIGTSDGVWTYNYLKNQIIKDNMDQIGEVRRIVKEGDSTLWVGTAYNGVYRIQNLHKTNKQISPFDTTSGLPTLVYNLPFKVNNQILFGTLYGIYEFNKSKLKFIKVQSFPNLQFSQFNQLDQIFQIIEAFQHKIWFFRSNNKIHEFIYYDQKNNKSTFPLRRMGEYDAYQCIFPENEYVTWFGGPDGLFKYDASLPLYDTLNFNTKITKVYCNNKTLFGGYWNYDATLDKHFSQSQNAIPEIDYKNNNINFEYAAQSFDNEKDNMYSCYLEGFDKNWSEWSSEFKKSYTNVNEGTYTFHVRSQNIYNKIGKEDTYIFVVLPPWYRTIWAYIAYSFGVFALIYVSIQISVSRLKRAKVRLEEVVKSRTAEVVAEKEEVLKQKKIVEVKNKDITDSINYAQKIQQAILPLPEDFSKMFPESFIYFQPRDIVSGDFYWFYSPNNIDQNWVYIAVADCTGHGVPGALMSMVGNSLLNEILNEKQIYETDLILNHLHTGVRSALKQDIAQNATNDGMDIALCRVNMDTFQLQYSGANRPLYIYTKSNEGAEFVEVKPNKTPIGGYQIESDRRFTVHNIQMKKNDTFYIFSDGYADQFGGESNKKFMVKRLQNELIAMQQFSMNQQKHLIKKLHIDWRGDTEQIDDILMIGVKI